VAAALDAYAAPIGSYKAKYRRTAWMLNGMVGVLGGYETINTHDVSGGSAIFGGFAAVGLHVTTPVGPYGADNFFHVGALFSLLDLGALTTRRFDQELDRDSGDSTPDEPPPEASAQPELSFTQVFSPGGYLTLGIGSSPLVFGVGVSYAPELRTVTDSGSEFKASALRYGAFLAVDVPILPLN
jgi:hypothetical protein